MTSLTRVTQQQQNYPNWAFTCDVVINYHWFMKGFPPLVATVLVPVIFIALKLAGVIDWPWGWVLATLWIPALLVLVVIALGAAVFTLAKWFLMARAWLRFRRPGFPGFVLTDPAVVSRIEAERAAGHGRRAATR